MELSRGTSLNWIGGQGSRPFVIAFVAVLAIGLVLLNMPRGANTSRADASNVELVALGQQVYRAQCASCHGVNLGGQPNWQQELAGGGRPAPPHDASGHTWHHLDQLLFDIVKQGGQASSPANYKNNMPGFATFLSDQEIWAVLAYIKSTWPTDIRAAQEQVTSQTQ
jgi:mono/diheme cytochrome c family protein